MTGPRFGTGSYGRAPGGRHEVHAAGWTEERTALCKKLFLEGLSASQVAAVLGGGATRNAVIGKIHREKWNRPGGSAEGASQAARAHAIGGRRNGDSGGGSFRGVNDARIRAQSVPGNRVGNTRAQLDAVRPARADKGSAMGARSASAAAAAEGMKFGAGFDRNGPVDADVAVLRSAAWEKLSNGPEPIGLVALTEHTCRWPVGEAPFRFCGAAPEEGSSYCSAHARRATAVPATPIKMPKDPGEGIGRDPVRSNARLFEGAF